MIWTEKLIVCMFTQTNSMAKSMQERIRQKPSNEDLLFISKTINEAEEDKSFYSRAMNKLYNEGTTFGFNGNYNAEKTEAK